jgi:hypothetical protein
MEVWDQGGLWLESMAVTGWRVAYESPNECLKWQHFENFDWTRESGDRRYASLKRLQRSIITALAHVHLVAIKVRSKV